METGRIILKAKLSNLSPIGIGSGRDDRSDRDVVITEYAFDDKENILPPETFYKSIVRRKLPFIPATSFLGKIFRQFDTDNHPEIKKYWGESEQNSSFIDCSDILITELPKNNQKKPLPVTEIRDGIRIDSAMGTVAKGAKFDYEMLSPGAKFSLTMIFRVENEIANYDLTLKMASDFARIIERGFDLGAKSTVGYGKIKGDEVKIYGIDFNDSTQFKQWIENDLIKNSIEKTPDSLLVSEEQSFEINASFKIKNSLIIRSYSKDPKAPDSTHLKSGGKNILSGSSIKGALRGRAERILNTIQSDESKTQTILEGLFGDVEKKEDGVTVKSNGYTVPSRVFVDEIPIEEVKEEIQTRIQIDRFTGGTVDGALIEEVPLFPKKGEEHIKNFRIQVKEPQPMDKGLMLLLFKDLWTEDLPIGGEKSIGRGVLTGVDATIVDGKETYHLIEDFKVPAKVGELQKYVTLKISKSQQK
jgi:CRISPR/Cas system CSM-associated protein Csm3 (group 7 of RAMP superfamily)